MNLSVSVYYEVQVGITGSAGELLMKDMVEVIGRPVDWRRSGMAVPASEG